MPGFLHAIFSGPHLEVSLFSFSLVPHQVPPWELWNSPHSDGGGELEDWQVDRQVGGVWGMDYRTYVRLTSFFYIYVKIERKNCIEINTIFFHKIY